MIRDALFAVLLGLSAGLISLYSKLTRRTVELNDYNRWQVLRLLFVAGGALFVLNEVRLGRTWSFEFWAGTAVALACLVVILLAHIGKLNRLDGEPTPDLETPNTYDRHGLRFFYPSNWRISDDRPLSTGHIVIVHSGRACAVYLMLLEQSDLDLDDFVSTYLEARRRRKPDLKTGAPSGPIPHLSPDSEVLGRRIIYVQRDGLGDSEFFWDFYALTKGPETRVALTRA